MGSRLLDPELEAEIAAIAESMGCELLEVEFRGGALRLVLDHPQGVTHAHCQSVSKQVSALLDVADFGSSRYVLEVSSPGLDRKLYGPRDYERFEGRLARVTFISPQTRVKRTIVGRIGGLEPPRQAEDGRELARELTVVEERSGEPFKIALADIEKARLEIEL